MKKDNIGRDIVAKEYFIRHFMKAVDTIIPVTRELESFMARDRAYRVGVCADRMIDDASKLLEKYHQTLKNGKHGIHSPFPMILVAFSKDNQPISPDRGMAIPYQRYTQLGDGNSQVYKMMSDFVEKRVQLAFFAHTSETAKAMTSQIRLYLQRYGNYRFPINWHFGGYEFELTGSFQDIPVADEIADIPERTNITVLVWNITMQFQIPYLQAPEPKRIITDKNGLEVVEGYPFTKGIIIDYFDDLRNFQVRREYR